MLTKRIIPCLDVKDGRTVKGTNFEFLRDMGDPTILAKMYSDQGADELVFLDIAASSENRPTLFGMIEKVAATLSIPFTVGGGVRSLPDVMEILDRGADKVCMNSAALHTPKLISEIAEKFGSQFVVVAIDYKKVGDALKVFSHGGQRPTAYCLLEWVKYAVELGAGELLLTAIDRDGTRSGFDCSTLSEINRAINVPIIASGGAGEPSDFISVFGEGQADAALAAGILHSGDVSIKDIKREIFNAGVSVRV